MNVAEWPAPLAALPAPFQRILTGPLCEFLARIVAMILTGADARAQRRVAACGGVSSS